MRAPAVSFAKRFAAVMLVALLTFALLPANALAEGEGDAGASAEGVQDISSSQDDEAAEASSRRVVAESQGRSAPDVLPDLGSAPAASSAEAGTLVASLMGQPASFVNADVALDGEPIVGSFTVDGLTFAVTEGSDVELVGAARAEGAFGSEVPTSPQPPSAPPTEASPLMLPESVAYNDVDYAVTSIGAYAFYLSGVTSVELSASVVEVDDRAFRSSDVASVEVAEGNSNYSSFDGALYDADQSSLLLIPEGKQGTVLLPSTAESAAPSVFSHCPLVTQIAVEEGSAAFASENGLLYDASLTTLLRVPAGATDITIREGCTSIATGAMEACASLATINAPATVTSISPDVFTSVPTVNLPAAALAEDAPQLSALVAVLSIADGFSDIDSSAITVKLSEFADWRPWKGQEWLLLETAETTKLLGSAVLDTNLDEGLPFADHQTAATSNSFLGAVTINGNGGTVTHQLDTGATNYGPVFAVNCYGNNWALFGNGAFHYFRSDSASKASVVALQVRPGYTFTGWKGSIDLAAGNGSYMGNTSMSFAAQWSANTITTTWNCNGGSIDGSGGPFSRSNAYDPSLNLGSVWEFWADGRLYRSGYTFAGWYTDKNNGNQVTANTVLPTSNTTYYAHWSPNSYTVEYRDCADTTTISKDNGFVYDAARNLADKPLSGVSVGYTAVGWATSKNQSSADYDFGSLQKNLATSDTKKLYLAEQPNTYTVTFDAAGGTAASDISATYDQELTLPASTRQGYAFAGWKDEATGTTYQAGNAKNLTAASNATVKLVAQWDPVIAAEVPLDVTAKVDLLGIEEQQQAQAYIKSLCGEPLRVACIELAPLPGARELFGDDVSQVSLEACAGADAVPVFSLTIGGTTFLSGGESLLALKMEGYGDEVPISYRFDIPDDLLPTLVEAARPVCQVAYTVGRA